MFENNVENTVILEQEEQKEKRFERRKGFRYGSYLFVKRCFDIIMSALFILIFSWVYIILAILVKCSDGGKVFYKHKRVGFLPDFE